MSPRNLLAALSGAVIGALGGILLISAWKMWHSHLRLSAAIAEPSQPDA